MKDIGRGDLMYREKPLFVLEEPATEAKIQDAIQNSQSIGQAFHDLQCTSPDRTDLGIYWRNNISLDEKRSGIFPEAAYFNHSCIPNAYYIWNEDLGCVTMYAVANIFKHDEITISHNDSCSFTGTSSRLSGYEVECCCQACQPGTSFGIGSRAR